MPNLVKLTIDGFEVEVPEGTTVLEAADKLNIKIPRLCFLKDINEIGACRMCIVDTGGYAFQAACVLPVANGMNVKTNTHEVREARRINLKLLLSNHDKKCLSCVRSQNCELQKLCMELGVDDDGEFAGAINEYDVDQLSPSIVRDNNKCISCRRCVSVCKNNQYVGVIGAVNRGFTTEIASAWGMSLNDTSCVACGQCIIHCPVGALREKSEIDDVWAALSDPNKHVVVQTAPAVRAALGEEFGMPMGTNVTNLMVDALHRLGFEKVFDTDFGADETIMEEAAELVRRIKTGGVLPMTTSCCPSWVKFAETYYPEFLPNVSTCKSPHQMAGATVKSYYAQHAGIDPKTIYTVSVMPCTAKKFEKNRPEMENDDVRNVDAVITTRELARMIKEAGIDFVNLNDGFKFDKLMGESTGAGTIFGAAGGVAEAALRTAYESLTGETLENVDFAEVRGTKGLKEANIQMGDKTIRCAAVNGLTNAAELFDSIKRGEKEYDFIEVMACPGGCVNGGGQPIITPDVREKTDPRAIRASALYNADKNMPKRKSHENEEIKALYREFMIEPGSHVAHKYLHTHFYERPLYTDK